MPPAFHTSLMLPWEIRMEEYSKLWENEVFVTWKAGSQAIGSCSAMHTSSCNVEAAGQSFDTFIKHHAAGSGVGDVMGGQALLRDFTTPQELESLRALANEQVAIACRFDTKFSNTAFTLLKKVHEAFIATGGIAQKFVDDMATASLNFIRDATMYEEELSSSDGIVFVAGLTCI